MATYLITGGCGFIGSHLAESLIENGDSVRILDNLSTGKLENVPPECEVFIGNVVNVIDVKHCMNGIDGVYHLAGVSSVQKSNDDWTGTHATNQTGSINIFDAAREHKVPVVYASSAAVYGDNADIPLKETSLARPLTAYGADKLGTELHARVASLVHDVPTAGMRLFNVYGPRQDPSSAYSGAISIFIDQAMSNSNINIYGDGEQTRDFIYVKDVVHFLRAGMKYIDCNPAVYNVCTGKSVSVNQLVKTIVSITSSMVEIEHLSERQGDIQVSVGDPTYSKKILDVKADETLISGIRRLVDFIGQENIEYKAVVNFV